jgi:hypothetical protein
VTDEKEVVIMKRFFGLALALAAAGAACGTQTAEPIAVTPLREVVLVDDGSTDPYACATIEVPDQVNEIDGHTVPAFASGFGGGDGVGGEGADYAGVCKQTREACWYIGTAGPCPVSPNCGGFFYDLASDTYSGGMHMTCKYACATDADCPAPATGTARAACSPFTNRCVLGCAGGETCPDGFVCVQSALTIRNSDGTISRPPLQCVQFKELRNLPAN